MGAKFIAKDDPDTKLATYMPNMFSPKFPAYCDAVAARECAPRASDPDLFGYFLDNEIHWWGAGSPDGGKFSCLLTWADRVSTFLFWRGANGKGVHPDASFFPERRLSLEPGEAYAPTTGTVYVVGLTGTGGASAWREASDELNEKVCK